MDYELLIQDNLLNTEQRGGEICPEKRVYRISDYGVCV
jgi:hypothetical protein